MFWKKRGKTDEKEQACQEIGKTMKIVEEPENGTIFSFNGIEIELKFGNAQHIGSRSTQEDSFGFSNLSDDDYISKHGVCAVVSDGMGGLSDGRKVSEYAVLKTLDFFDTLDTSKPIWEEAEGFIQRINTEVCNVYCENGRPGAGATLVILIIRGDKAYWCTVGDSRIYLLRRGHLYQINEDHDYRNQLLERYIEEEISWKQVVSDRQGGALTSYIGCPSIGRIDRNIRAFSLEDGDRFLLMTDGVYRALSEDEILQRKNMQPQKMCDRLIEAASDKKLPGQDNMSLLIVDYNWVKQEE